MKHLFAKNDKVLENLIQAIRIFSENKAVEFGIKKMCHANNELWEKTNDGRNRTTKSRMNQNAWRKGKLQVLENIGNGHHQTSQGEKKKKNLKREFLRNKKST